MATKTIVTCDKCGESAQGLTPISVRYVKGYTRAVGYSVEQTYVCLDLCSSCRSTLLVEMCSGGHIVPITYVRKFMEGTQWVEYVRP